jgi:uncharacterized membrane protein
VPAAKPRAKATGLGSWIAPPRFLLFVAVLVLGAAALRLSGVQLVDSLEYAFDAAAAVFLISMWPLLGDIGAAKMRIHSRDNEANRALVLIITMIMSLVVFAAIAGDLPKAKKGDLAAMSTLIGTMFLAWAYTNTVFALHYAHAFYSDEPKEGGDVGGLEFPGTKEPDYWDFLYFSFTLGMSFGSPDVNVTRGAVRRVVVVQSFIMFVYNIGVVAFIINALGGGGG